MKLLLDTHLLLWAAADDPALPAEARTAIEDTDNTLYFSVASLWEIVIKSALGRECLPAMVDPGTHACQTCILSLFFHIEQPQNAGHLDKLLVARNGPACSVTFRCPR